MRQVIYGAIALVAVGVVVRFPFREDRDFCLPILFRL